MWLTALIPLLLVQYLAANCDVCLSTTNVACHNETSFSICTKGRATNSFIECPLNHFCTDGKNICYENVEPTCKRRQEPFPDDGETKTTEELTTTLELATSTPEPWSAEKTCQQAIKQINAKNEDDPTCTTYILCYASNGSFKPLKKSCKKNAYFDETERMCGSTKPEGCI